MSLRSLARHIPPGAKRTARQMAAKVEKRIFGTPHPWYDLLNEVKRNSPDIMLDIGGHVGEMTMEMASAFPKMPVHAFEPTPTSFKTLTDRVSKFKNVSTHQLALGAESGTASFFLNSNAQTNSLLDNTEGNTKFMPGGTKHETQVDVDVVCLDDWMDTNAPGASLAAKVDIQGAELMLIKGGKKTFSDQVQSILFEVEYRDLYEGGATFFEIHDALTKDLDFVLAQVYTAHRLGHRAAWGDALFINKKFTS